MMYNENVKYKRKEFEKFMAKAKKCTLIENTPWGYVCQPLEFPSIRQALNYAKNSNMAYRIFVDGKLVKSGWFR